MKSLLKYVSIFGFAISIFALTACNGQPNFDVTLENGSELAIETHTLQLTNQQMFELVAGGYVNWMNPGVSVILDWADDIILSDLVQIDEALIEEEMEFIKNFFDEDALQEMLISQGFDSLDAYFANERLALMREQAVLDAVEISEEEILDIYNTWFVPSEEELEEEADVEDSDANEVDEETDEETPVFEKANTIDEIPEETRHSIEEILRNEILETPGFEQEVLANLRAEAGLTIYSSYFATRYENFLEAWGNDDVHVSTGNNDSAIASINGQYLTVDELFDTVVARFAIADQSPLFNYIDRHILNEIYQVERRVIRNDIDEAKLSMLDWFYPQMESQGLLTEEQIFDFFMLSHLQELAFNDAFVPISDQRLQELYELHIEDLKATFESENTPNRSARHILVDEVELAKDLITQLQAVDEDEVEDLFIELAEEHSNCPSAANGGDLGSFPRHPAPGSMVIEFDEAAFALELYEFTTEPVETSHGFHVIYLYEIEELENSEEEFELPTFQEARPTLIENELQRLRNTPRYFANVIFGLRADQQIRFHNEQLQAQYDLRLEQNRNSIEN